MWITFALTLAASCPTCSLEDAQWEATKVQLALQDGASTLTLHGTVRHAGAPKETHRRPSGISIDATIPRGQGAIVDGILHANGRTLRSVLTASENGIAAFAGFTSALLYGGDAANTSDANALRADAADPNGPFAGLIIEKDVQTDVIKTSIALPWELVEVDLELHFRLTTFTHKGEVVVELPRIDGVDWQTLPLSLLEHGKARTVRALHVARPSVSFIDVDGQRALLHTGRFLTGIQARSAKLELKSAMDAVAVASKERSSKLFLRAELALPTTLQAAPRSPFFVFVVDNSVSMRVDRMAAAYRHIEAVLDAAGSTSQYSVLAMGRSVTVLVPPWTPGQTRSLLHRARRHAELSNGSNALAALKLAQGIARDVPRKEDVRIVFYSDVVLPFAQLGEPFHTRLSKGRITHVVQLSGIYQARDTFYWTRQFDGRDVDAVHQTDGTWIDASPEDAPRQSTLANYLVHPTRLDRPGLMAFRGPEDRLSNVAIGGLHLGRVEDSTPEMDEGQALVYDLRVGAQAASELPDFLQAGSSVGLTAALNATRTTSRQGPPVFSGWLWGHQVQLAATSTAATKALLPAVATGGDVAQSLPDLFVSALSTLSGAVSRTSSRLALPQWRPPAQPARGGMGCGCAEGWSSSCGGARTHCAGGFRSDNPAIDQAALSALIAGFAPLCGPSSGSLAIEVGDREILAIASHPSREQSAEQKIVLQCVVARLWRTRLDLRTETLGAKIALSNRQSLFRRHRVLEVQLH